MSRNRHYIVIEKKKVTVSNETNMISISAVAHTVLRVFLNRSQYEMNGSSTSLIYHFRIRKYSMIYLKQHYR